MLATRSSLTKDESKQHLLLRLEGGVEGNSCFTFEDMVQRRRKSCVSTTTNDERSGESNSVGDVEEVKDSKREGLKMRETASILITVGLDLYGRIDSR